jgi:hypothetical protein
MFSKFEFEICFEFRIYYLKGEQQCLSTNINVGSVEKFLRRSKKSTKERNRLPVLIAGHGSLRKSSPVFLL